MPTRILGINSSDDDFNSNSTGPRPRDDEEDASAPSSAAASDTRDGGGTMTQPAEDEERRRSGTLPDDDSNIDINNMSKHDEGDDWNDAVEVVKSLLGSKVECCLRDGRTVSGRLVCVDRLSNIILADCWEERTVFARDYHPPVADDDVEDGKEQAHDPPSRVVRRQLAQAMIPGPALVSVTMDRSAYEKARKKKTTARGEASTATATVAATSTGTASATEGGREG